jgi:cobalamin biosynthesis protein CobT
VSDTTYYFYFDTCKATSGSRGIALTDQAIVWKNMLGSSISWNNLTGSASRVAFDEISKISLIHELGLSSITGWKLRLNDNGDHDIVLAQLTEENVEMFAKAIVYFINIAAKASLILDIPQETQEILTKTFLERHPEIKSVTDSIFGAIMPSKTGEETEGDDEGIVTQAKEKMTEGVTKAKEFVEQAAGEVGKAASEVGKSVKEMATGASSAIGTMISGEKKSEEEEASEDEASEDEASEDEASEDEASEDEESDDEESDSQDEAAEDK